MQSTDVAAMQSESFLIFLGDVILIALLQSCKSVSLSCCRDRNQMSDVQLACFSKMGNGIAESNKN